MTGFEFGSWSEFVAANRRRSVPLHDVGELWRSDDQPGEPVRISWVPSTGEVVAMAARQPNGRVSLLGTAAGADLLAAILITFAEGRNSLAWARAQIADLPTDPAAIAQVIRDADAWRKAQRDAERRIHYRRFAIADPLQLPDPDPLLGRGPEPCDCRHCRAGDWRAIAEAAVSLVAERVLEPWRVRIAAPWLLPPDENPELLVRLFLEPIQPTGGEYRNGRHRVHAMRRAGVRRCVIQRDPAEEEGR